MNPIRSHAGRAWRMALLSATLFGLAACNTMKGVGEDVEEAGEEIQEEAEEHD
jgi:predicted small secreted protein